MRRKILSVYARLAQNSRKVFIALFFFILATRLLLLLIKVQYVSNQLPAGYEGFWGIFAGDSPTYLYAWENGLRMPLMAILIDFFHLFTNIPGALNLLILLQILVSSLATVYVGRILYLLTGKFYLALIAIILYCHAFQVILYDWVVLPQSLAASFFVFTSFYALRYFKSNSNKDLFKSLIFSYLVYFLYPTFVGIMLPVICLAIYINRDSLRQFSVRLILYLLPFCILEGAYMIFNGAKFGTYSTMPPKYNAFGARDDNEVKHELFQFGMAVGIDICSWQPGAEIRWFPMRKIPLSNGTDGYDEEITFPFSLLEGSRINKDSLLTVRQNIIQVRDSLDTNPFLTDSVENQLNRFTDYIKKEKPFQYYIGSRLRILKLFFQYKGNDSVFFREGNTSWATRILKPVVQLVYWPILFLSLLFPFVVLFKRDFSPENLFLLFLYGYSIYMFPLVFKVIEHRYFSTGYFVLLTFAILAVYEILQMVYSGRTIERKEKTFVSQKA